MLGAGFIIRMSVSLGKQFKRTSFFSGPWTLALRPKMAGEGFMVIFTYCFSLLSVFTDSMHYRFEIDASLKQSNNRSTFCNWTSHSHFVGHIRQCVLLPRIRQLFYECLERGRKPFCNATSFIIQF